jgi:serine protease Do
VTRPAAAAVLLALVLLGLAAAAEARQYAWLGVRIRDLSEHEMEELAKRHGIREGFGVFIVEVMDDTPAKRAGLRSGDIVVAFDGRPVVEGRMLQRLIAAAPVEQETRLTVLRPDGRAQLAVRLGVMPRTAVGERVAAEFGFFIRDSDAQGELGGRRPVASSPAIAAVARGGPAEKAGLEVGDVILQVEDQAVLTRDAAREALADAPTERPLRLTVRRGDQQLSFTLTATP